MTLFNANFPIVCAGSRVLARDLRFMIKPGQIIGLTGPNGCGKSIALDCICGLIRSPGSSIKLRSIRIDKLSTYDRWQCGIRRLYQQPSLAGNTTISSAIQHFAASSTVKSLSIGRKILAETGLRTNQTIGSLSYGQRRLVEMVAISHSGKVFLLDEPFAGVSGAFIPIIVEAVQQLRDVGGVIIVDQSVDRLKSIADNIVDWPSNNSAGIVAVPSAQEVSRSFTDAICGKPRTGRWYVQNIVAGERLLTKKMDIETRPGELLYLLGPNGSGKSSILRALAGIPQPVGINCGGYVSDVHQADIHFSPQPPKLVPTISVYDNLSLMCPENHIKWVLSMRFIESLMEIGGLDNAIMGRRADRLSGGEAAVISLIGAAASGKSFLLLDEPFEGLSTSRQAFAAAIVASLLSNGLTIVVTAHSVILKGIEANKIMLAGVRPSDF